MKVQYVKDGKVIEKEVTEEQVQHLFNACVEVKNRYKDADYTAADAVDMIVHGKIVFLRK